MPKIAIIQKYIPQYRLEFFTQLRDSLHQKNIDLILIYGQPNQKDSLRKDSIKIDWAIEIPNKIIHMGKREFYWQSIFSHLKDVDLVIVEQASKILNNYPLLLNSKFKKPNVAFWGHGKNFQENTVSQLGEWIKKQVSKHVHWWFAYTEISAKVVSGLGYPTERISIVQNAIDTISLHDSLSAFSEAEVDSICTDLHIQSRQIGLFIGGMYPEKQLSFLLQSLYCIKKQIPEFEMLFIGDGIDSPIIKQAAESNQWIHFIGPKFGDEKVPFFALSRVMLIPFSVGLTILESFACETPLITIDSPLHGPEICYLENGVNGIKIESPCSPEVYANTVVSLLQDQVKYEIIIKKCEESFKKYTVQNMVINFVVGIEKALSS